MSGCAGARRSTQQGADPVDDSLRGGQKFVRLDLGDLAAMAAVFEPFVIRQCGQLGLVGVAPGVNGH